MDSSSCNKQRKNIDGDMKIIPKHFSSLHSDSLPASFALLRSTLIAMQFLQ